MGSRLRGITVTLYDKQKVGTDAFNQPVYEEIPVDVENVLIGEPTSEDVAETFNMTGKHIAYSLAIPKGDTHVWTNRKVSFWGGKYRTIGEPVQGIDSLVPLSWNKKIRVEKYE